MEMNVHAKELWKTLLDLKKAGNSAQTISLCSKDKPDFFHLSCDENTNTDGESMLYSASISGLKNLIHAMKREGYEDPKIVAQDKAKDFFILTYNEKK